MKAATPCCRLCQGQVEKQFDLVVLGRHEVGYSRCHACGSLQTDEPSWLEEAYATSLTVSDVGAVYRCLTCRAAVWMILQCLRMRRVRLLDYGGGSGLLCRLLRDVGIDAWTADPHGSSEYARLFQVDADTVAPGAFDVVTSFEVFEHMPHPGKDLARLFQLSPQVVIASTEPYEGNGGEWWYLTPNTGQHVFFYSRPALQLIGDRFGYAVHSVGTWHIFMRRPIGPIVRTALRGALFRPSLQVGRILLEARPARWGYIARDFEASLARTGNARTGNARTGMTGTGNDGRPAPPLHPASRREESR